MHKLLIEDDEGKTVAVPLIREEITIGRSEGNTIRLTEQNVSRKHARLTLRNGVLQIEDLGSYNGTSLNGSGLGGLATLKDGDVILIGDYRLGIQEDKTVMVGAPASAPATDGLGSAPAVGESMDGQPTIPISTLIAQTPLAEPPARLIVLSRFMAGSEFLLDRPAQVIGRTPENDIIINHKSISRHHAKVVREGNRYVILDLESANGVRVGGTEHDRVELNSGDVIELGEVRLRFLTADAPVFEEPAAFYRNKKFIALAAAGGTLGLVLVLLLVGGNEAKLPPSIPVVAEPAAPPPAEPVTPPPPIPEVKPAPPPPVPVADLLASAKRSAEAERWDDALSFVGNALAQEPASTDAAELRDAYTAERQTSEKYAALKLAFENKDYATVVEGASGVPEGSVYRERTVEMERSAQTQYVGMHLDLAKGKLEEGDCDEAKREAQLVLAIEAKNKRAAGIVRRCDVLAKAAAAPPEPTPKPEVPKPAPVRHLVQASKPAPARARAPEPPRSEPASVAPADPDKLIKDAQQAWFRGQYAAAIDAARKALRIRPTLTNAYQIIAVCSCALHDADSAAKAFDKLDDRNKQWVKASCQKNGISF